MPRCVFDEGKLLALLGGTKGVSRLKGVFHLPDEWIAVNRVGTDVSVTPTAYRRDSRLEVFSDSLDWSNFEAELKRCLSRCEMPPRLLDDLSRFVWYNYFYPPAAFASSRRLSMPGGRIIRAAALFALVTIAATIAIVSGTPRFDPPVAAAAHRRNAAIQAGEGRPHLHHRQHAGRADAARRLARNLSSTPASRSTTWSFAISASPAMKSRLPAAVARFRHARPVALRQRTDSAAAA